MKVSYKVLKKYIPDIKPPQEVAQDLIMHTAEVEEIHDAWAHLDNVYIGEVVECHKHPNADTLNICQVHVLWETRQIICGAPNVTAGIKVAVALPWAELKPGFVIQKTKIRGETSNGMICSEDELSIVDERQDGILILPENAPIDTPVKTYFEMNDVILEIDNKAINHRPDLFSHIGIAREISAIAWAELGYTMAQQDFTHLPDLWIQNSIKDVVKRYMWLKVSGVENTESPDYIKDVLASHDVDSKWILVDITNYSLYLYGQPTHCFDADTIQGNIQIRYAKDGETFTGLNDKTYTLTSSDIAIADDSGVIALWGIIGGKDSAVWDNTKNIIIESAWFDQAVIRKTGKRLGIRTDSLNVFEKDLVPSLRDTGPSLIVQELAKYLPDMKLEAFTDVYESPESPTQIEFDVPYIQKLIWRDYTQEKILSILESLWIKKHWEHLMIPLWRKDLTNKSDIAEEVARIDGYDKIETTIPRINIGAVSQTPMYNIKKDARNYLVSRGMYDMYNYSFVNENLMKKCGSSTQDLIWLKNALSEDLTHMRDDLIPNLLMSLEENAREYKNLKLFEIGKVFHLRQNEIFENYEISGVISEDSENQYYTTQTCVGDLLQKLWVARYSFAPAEDIPCYAHPWRIANIIVRGKPVGFVWEIHPWVTANFDLVQRVWFFSIDANLLEPSTYQILQAQEVSQFQENNFDINFVVEKQTPASDIQGAIEKTDPNIRKVELFDIYENQEKLPWQRSLSFTVYYQSMTETLDDTYKNQLIANIVKNVEKKWGKLR